MLIKITLPLPRHNKVTKEKTWSGTYKSKLRKIHRTCVVWYSYRKYFQFCLHLIFIFLSIVYSFHFYAKFLIFVAFVLRTSELSHFPNQHSKNQSTNSVLYSVVRIQAIRRDVGKGQHLYILPLLSKSCINWNNLFTKNIE